MKITAITSYPVNVSAKTNWLFLKVDTDSGLSGLGEATLSGGWEDVQRACVARLAAMIVGETVDAAMPILGVYPHSAGGLAWNSVLSAAEMALTDIRAREKGVPVYALFGAAERTAIPVYGNINRMTTNRSPAGFAESARIRLAEGYRAIKLAPFDGVHWEDLGRSEVRKRLANGIDCVLACREAIGPDVRLMIDCHWRFDEKSTQDVMRELEPARLFWAECMVSERAEFHPALQRLRRFAEERGVLLAGGERQVGVWGFEPIAQGRLLDVVMPDVKYAGGYSGLLAIARRTAQAGIKFSPHNPTGPVCTLASLHVCALAANFLILERQTEGSVYADIILGTHPAFENGHYRIPEGPGLGIDLNFDAIAARPYRKPAEEALSDPRLG